MGKLMRKGTGFVHMGELPVSDDDDDDAKPTGGNSKAGVVKIQDGGSDGGDKKESKLQRKGTGFVHMGELPLDSEDEDDDDDDAKPTGGNSKAGGVKIQDGGPDGGEKKENKLM